jgi:NitT/TauT family transport system permease protein
MRPFSKSFFIAHILMAALIILIHIPGQKSVEDPKAFFAGIVVIELIYLYQLVRKRKSPLALSDIMIILWSILLLWEISTTQLNLMHPVLVPSPENVFHVFATQYDVLLLGVLSSMELLLVGVLFGIGFGVGLGLPVGWIPRLRDIFYPIANVLTPIPPVVFAPYLIALMPTFRSASAVVIILTIFWPTFLSIIIRVNSIEPRILDSARVLNVSNRTMIRKILLPYVIPSVISGLKVTITTSVMMLTFAEMMGATSGMGFYIINYTHYANYTNVVADIILVGIVVTVLNWLVNIIQIKTIKWH